MSLSARSVRSAALFRSAGVLHARSFAASSRRLAGQDYGSGTGDPRGEKPQEQGPNPSADKEHPGPPPPKVGQGTGGATKKGGEGHNTGSAAQSRQTKGFHTFAASDLYYAQRRGYASMADKPKGDIKNAKPTLLNENPPSGEDQPSEVRQHNEEMDQRAEKAAENVSNEDAEKDKVKPGFWSGHAGKPSDQKKHT